MLTSAVSAPSDSNWVLVVPALVAVALALLICALLAIRRGRFVAASSLALKQLDEMNVRVKPYLPVRPPIRSTFATRVNSKSKFGRFDLHDHMCRNILENERWFEQEVALRLDAVRNFGAYHQDFEALARASLGKSGHPRVSEKRFPIIERKKFHRRKLAYPVPKAIVSSTVSYTSPKGKNSYSGRLQWNFDQLNEGLRSAQAARARQSTQEYLRQKERSMMSASMRMTVLRRDGSRCCMCGARAVDGAVLHVDHIRPVSLGGRTVLENLQTLCQTCNLGKSNRFVG